MKEEKISKEMAEKLVFVLNEHSLTERELRAVTNECLRVWTAKGLIKE